MPGVGRPITLTDGEAFAYVAAWEFECCGLPHRVGDVVAASATPTSLDHVDGCAWDHLLSEPVDWVVSHHDTGVGASVEEPASCPHEGVIVRVWEAWARTEALPGGGLTAAPQGARLIETGSTSPHQGSSDAQVSPSPPGICPGAEHWGWVLQLLWVNNDAAAQQTGSAIPTTSG